MTLPKYNILHRLAALATFSLCSILPMWLGGCSSDGCLEGQTAIPLAGFYALSDKPHAVSVTGIAVYGIGQPGDSILYTPDQSLKQIYLPLSSLNTSCQWVIAYEMQGLDGLADTLSFHYSPVLTFVSNDCGCVYHYHIHSLQYTRHVVDSIAIVGDSVIHNIDTEMLKIYMKVDPVMPN